MQPPALFSDDELAFLKELLKQKVDFMIVGLAAASLQGAPAITQGIDLWFRDPGSSVMREAIERAGANYVAPTEQNPPLLAGAGADLFDIVVHMHGLGEFDDEMKHVTRVKVGGIALPVLSLQRIIVSKEATDRDKDRAILPALRDALRVLEDRKKR